MVGGGGLGAAWACNTGLATTASERDEGNANASGAAAPASRLRHTHVTAAGSTGCARRAGRSQAARKQPAQTSPAVGVSGAGPVSPEVTGERDWLEAKGAGHGRSQSRVGLQFGGNGWGAARPGEGAGSGRPSVTGCSAQARPKRGAGPLC